jgi:DNA-binding MarR family transcriptional regulator
MNVNHAIEETVGFQLVQICKAHRNKAQEILSRLDLHPGQEIMLFNLMQQDGQTQHELAEHMCVQPATMTKMVDRMVQAGFIVRIADTEDQRVSRIHLSQKGRDMREPVQNAWYELESLSLSNLTTEERLLLRRLLLQIDRNLT